MSDKRKEKRQKLIRYLRVYDRATDRFVGHLVNISNSGMLLVSEAPFPGQEIFQFWVEIVAERMALTARSVWCSMDETVDSFHTGFEFVEMTPEMETKIECLVYALKGRDI